MDKYVAVVVGLNFMVDFLLLRAAGDKCDCPTSAARAAAAAGFGGIYSGLCMQPGLHFLGNGFWRLTCLVLMALIVFGVGKDAVRKGAVFLFFWLVICGMAAGLTGKKAWSLVLAVCLGCFVYLLCFQDGDRKRYLPVCIRHGEKAVKLTALLDTGNLLQDPVTGESVLIVSPSVGVMLLDLTAPQLRDPLETMTSAGIPGLRLIPYSAVGKPCGLLLAKRFGDVTVGDTSGARIVAFSPSPIGEGKNFQALAGGMA